MGMLLLRADDTAMGWMHDVWNTLHTGEADPLTQDMVVRRWVFEDDAAWVGDLLQRAHVLKFIGKFCWLLDAQPQEHLLERRNSISRLLAQTCRPAQLPTASILPVRAGPAAPRSLRGDASHAKTSK